MKQNFFAVDLGATSGRTILGSFIEGGLNLEEINRFPNHLIEVDISIGIFMHYTVTLSTD